MGKSHFSEENIKFHKLNSRSSRRIRKHNYAPHPLLSFIDHIPEAHPGAIENGPESRPDPIAPQESIYYHADDSEGLYRRAYDS